MKSWEEMLKKHSGARFASERDFVASFLLPKLKDAARLLGMADLIDFHVEKPIDGVPDLTAEKGGKGLFVIESKFKKKVGKIERDIEPRDPDVVIQAFNYAGVGGFPYYATCNIKRLILFKLRPGIRMLESEVASFDFERDLDWAKSFLKTVSELVPIRLKPPDDILVDTLHEAFNDLYPELLGALNERLRDEGFRGRYVEWLENQGIKGTDETNRLMAEQTTYLQLNKLLFYQVIKAIYPDRLGPLRIDEKEDVSEALGEFFQEVLEIDYASIYQRDIISEIPFTLRAKERIRTLLDTLNEFDFSIIESDFIGRIYEKLIPPLERKRLGQFYTPPGIVDLIVQLTVTNPNAKVLDPGCGSGSFLVRTYHKLRELNKLPRVLEGPYEVFHKKLLEHLYGIDINQFPTHLTVINLAVQNPKAKIEGVGTIVGDFFDVRPGRAIPLGFEGISTAGMPTQIEMPLAFDVVVANPPYIRQELLGEKEKLKIKALIEDEYKGKLFIGAPPKKAKGAIVLNKQGDIYIYFYIHGLKFLKNGGRLGFISSNKWFEVKYGEPFQRFLLDNCKILYIIEFDKAVFPDAEVNTEVTILEKHDGEKNRQTRDKNLVKFIHINRAIAIDQLLNRIQSEDRVDDEDLRISTIRQGDLRPGKWGTYLRAPPVYFKLIKNPKLKPLGLVTQNIVSGVKTGYDPYFIPNKETVNEWKIERRYLKPCIPPGSDIPGLAIRPEDIKQYFVMVHDKKQDLEGTNVLKYIEYGEKLKARASKRRKEAVKLPEVETIKNRELWYSLPQLPTPAVFFPMWFRYKYRAFLNSAEAQGHNFWYYIIVDEQYGDVFAAILNSTITQFFVELSGRQYSGILAMTVYELKRLPTLDPTDFSDSQKKRLKDLCWKLNDAVIRRNEVQEKLGQFRGKSEKEKGPFEKEVKEELDAICKEEAAVVSQIDEIIYDTLGLSQEDRIAIAKGLKHLREARKRTTRGLRIKTEE